MMARIIPLSTRKQQKTVLAPQFNRVSGLVGVSWEEWALSAASDSDRPTKSSAVPVEPGGRFKFDVFISHSSSDKTIADAVCHTLEANGLRCWIAPRDIVPGSDWSEGIFQGIDSSRTFVLVFTNRANESKHVLREVGRAFSKNSVVIPFRVEDIQPSRGLEYWISQSHWLDAMTPPFQQHLERLVQIVRSNLDLPPTPPTQTQHQPSAVRAVPKVRSDSSPASQAKSVSTPQSPGRQRPPESIPPPPQRRAVRERIEKEIDSVQSPPLPTRGSRPGSILRWFKWMGGAALLLGIALIFTFVISAIISPPTSGGRESANSYSPTQGIRSSDSLTGTIAGDTREITLSGGVKLKQVWCPPGTFMMGSPASEKGRAEDEDDTTGAGGKPVQVTLTKGYWLAATETTQGQWTAVMGAASKPWSGQEFVKEGPNFPVSYISHGVNPNGTIEADSATAFCEKLTEIERKAGKLPTGWKYELPTEAQWEYACRAGTTTAYSFKGDGSQLGDYAWFDKNAWGIGEKYAHEVGQKKANPWGLSDMHGNLWEWCRDRYAAKIVGGTNTGGPLTGSDRVDLGGGFFNPAGYSRSACRGKNAPSARQTILGFRVCLSSP